MASPAFSHFLPRFGVAAAVASALSLAGCQSWNTQDTLPPTSGVQPLKGLAQNVSVRRNAVGVPLIESSSFHDALFTLGYVHASDRIGQMVTLRLLAQGRLAEMSGADALEVDRLMRSQMTATDAAARKAIYDRVQLLLSENLPVIFLASPHVLAAGRRELGNLEPAVLEPVLLWNCERFFWSRPRP